MSHVESPRSRWISRLFVFGITLAIGSLAISKEWISGIIWQEPVVIEPGSVGGPPSDAIVLFNGTDMSQWTDGDTWLVQDGYASPRKGNVRTKASFSDCQLHIEWAAPEQVSGSGQGRGIPRTDEDGTFHTNPKRKRGRVLHPRLRFGLV